MTLSGPFRWHFTLFVRIYVTKKDVRCSIYFIFWFCVVLGCESIGSMKTVLMGYLTRIFFVGDNTLKNEEWVNSVKLPWHFIFSVNLGRRQSRLWTFQPWLNYPLSTIEWSASNFSWQYHCQIKCTGKENEWNDQHWLNVLIFEQILSNSTLRNIWRTVKRI